MSEPRTPFPVRADRAARVEGVVQVVIMLAIGAAAAAASFTHVHDVAEAHGQPGWLAWADAIVLELMSVAGGLELRRFALLSYHGPSRPVPGSNRRPRARQALALPLS